MLTILVATVLHAGQVTLAVTPRRSVADPRELMVEAIDAPDGQAHGMLAGEMAGALARGFDTNAPLNIDVSTLKRYRQDGCRRLNVAFSQENVRLPGEQGHQPRRIDIGVDYCRNGRPPSSHELEAP